VATTWQLQDAKNRFSQVVDDAIHKGPQTVTRRGEAVVVVVSVEEWRRLTETRPTLKDYLREVTLDGVDLARDTGERQAVDLP
jgi:prevent-host-death family protein